MAEGENFMTDINEEFGAGPSPFGALSPLSISGHYSVPPQLPVKRPLPLKRRYVLRSKSPWGPKSPVKADFPGASNDLSNQFSQEKAAVLSSGTNHEKKAGSS